MKLVTTSVVRGSQQGQSHGGVYLIDLERRSVRQTIDWNKGDIDWQGRGWDRGLRGIAFDGGLVYIAASDELFAFTPDFRPAGSWRNSYLKHCHEIAVYERTPVPDLDRLRQHPGVRSRCARVPLGDACRDATSSASRGPSSTRGRRTGR